MSDEMENFNHCVGFAVNSYALEGECTIALHRFPHRHCCPEEVGCGDDISLGWVMGWRDARGLYCDLIPF